MRRERVLITGGAGFIGAHTALALVEGGYRVRVLDSLHPQVHGPGRRWPSYLCAEAERLRGDVLCLDDLREALDGADWVFHFCSETGVGQSMEEVSRYYAVNVQGTANLFHSIRQVRRKPRGVLLSSSRAIYGEGRRWCPRCRKTFFPGMRSVDDLRHGRWEVRCPGCRAGSLPRGSRETDPPRPCSTYAITKWQQEEMVRFYCGWLGIPWVVLRYFNVYGPWQSPQNPYTGIVVLFMRLARAAKQIDIFEDGRPARDFVYVEDVVQANLAALARMRHGCGTYNVGSGEVTTIAGLADAIDRVLGTRTPRLRAGHFREGDIRTCLPDLRENRRTLGYRPSTLLERGLRQLLEWFRSR